MNGASIVAVAGAIVWHWSTWIAIASVLASAGVEWLAMRGTPPTE